VLESQRQKFQVTQKIPWKFDTFCGLPAKCVQNKGCEQSSTANYGGFGDFPLKYGIKPQFALVKIDLAKCVRSKS
jgi:hypothetical protein